MSALHVTMLKFDRAYVVVQTQTGSCDWKTLGLCKLCKQFTGFARQLKRML